MPLSVCPSDPWLPTERAEWEKNSFANDVSADSCPWFQLLARRELGAASLEAGKPEGDVVRSCILP